MRSLGYFLKHPKSLLSSFLRSYGRLIPDSLYLRWQYKLIMGRSLNLKNPRLFTEKIQWLKIFNRKPEMTIMVDKYAAKDFVAQKIGKKYIIPTLGVWNSAEDIDLDSLPDSFVLKTTHGGGSTGVVVIKDKARISKNEVIARLNMSLKRDVYSSYREWPYKNVRRRIIAEKYIEINGQSDLTDYKVFCFNGKARYIQVIQDRNTCETIDFFDSDWRHQEFVGLNPVVKNAASIIPRPKCLEEMIWVAEQLAEDYDFVRIDLYQIEDTVFFGEITFYPASGIGIFSPEEYDLKLGELINLTI